MIVVLSSSRAGVRCGESMFRGCIIDSIFIV